MPQEKAGHNEAGRVCPYCHTPIEAAEAVHSCEACSAVHHEDCWHEGEGCAVFGCDQGPSRPEENPADASGRSPRPPGSPGSTAAAGPASPDRRGLLRKVLVGLVLLAAAVLIYFLVIAGDGEENPQPPTSDRSLSRAERLARMDARLDRMEVADRNSRRGEFERATDPGGNWTAELPGGSRWTEPEDQGDQNTPDNPRYRTVFWGPDGAFVLIETTPYEDPIQNEMNYTIDGIRYPATPLDDARMDYAEMIEFEAASGDCAGLSCAKVLLADGVGGGIAVLVGSENAELSERVASRIGSSISTDR